MLFLLVLHSFQLSGAEAAETGFNGEKWTSSCLIRSTPNSMKIDADHYFEDSLEETKDGPEGTHQGFRRVPGAAPPRARQAPSWMPGGPPRCPLCPILPPWGKNPKKRGVSEFRRRLVAETYREEKA